MDALTDMYRSQPDKGQRGCPIIPMMQQGRGWMIVETQIRHSRTRYTHISMPISPSSSAHTFDHTGMYLSVDPGDLLKFLSVFIIQCMGE